MPTGAKIISDRVLPSNESPPQPADRDEANLAPASQFRLASLHQGNSADFERGLDAYRNGSKADALAAFDAAIAAAPGNALFQYYRALTIAEMSGTESAGQALRLAVATERQEPVANWGKSMERVQGRNRVWIEKARREAGLVR